MKKVLLVFIALLLLCACSNKSHDSFVSDGNEVIFTKPDGSSYTKQDLYDDMKLNDITAYLTNDMVSRLAVFEGIDMEALREEAQADADAAVEAGQEYYIIYYYGSVEKYVEEMIPYKALQLLCKEKIEEKLDDYVKEYAPFKASIAWFDSAEAAQNVIDAVNSGENTFAYAASKNGYTSIVEETLYTDKDNGLPVEVKDYINSNASGLSPIIETSVAITDAEGNSTSIPRYYLVDLITKDVNDFKDDFISVITAETDTTEIISELLQKYEVSIHDQRAYDLLTAVYEVLK